MKIIIAGSRGFYHYPLLREEINKFLVSNCDPRENVTIVSGMAKGADSLGEQYASELGLNIIKMPAEWDKNGKSAGYIRNAEMAEVADAAVIFWDGKSKGAKHMIDLCVKKKLIFKIVMF